jgi:tRNA(Met) cytidine acetyltransferase
VAAAEKPLIRDLEKAGCIARSFTSVGELLGFETGNAVIATSGLLSPNTVAALAGLVKASGILAIVAPMLGEWNPGPRGGRGGYRRYLLDSFLEAESLLWLSDEDECRVIAEHLPRPREPGPRGEAPRTSNVPKRLARLLTEDQLRAFSKYLGAQRRLRSLLVVGDRGRGKSFLLGSIAAYEAYRGLAGDAALVAPSKYSAQSFFRGFIAASKALGLEPAARKKKWFVESVAARNLSIALRRPDEGIRQPIVFVDEAAAVGVARLRRYGKTASRVYAATTLHGYEGAGRYLAHYAENILPKPLLRVELQNPVRYAPGDPLEEWVNKVFVLKPQYPEPPRGANVSEIQVEVVDPNKLSGNKVLVRHIVSLLWEAHYRTEPDYLLTLLESTTHEIVVAKIGGELVAVADVAYEEPGLPEKGRLTLHLINEQLARSGENLRAARIVRIAVHPMLQRRGIGSRLLASIEARASEKGYPVVTTIYGRHDVLRFWLRNGYKVFYISPRYNKVTGEKNIAMVKPVREEANNLVKELIEVFTRELLLAAHILYRDVSAEKVASILASMREQEPVLSIPVTSDDKAKLQKALQNPEKLEQVAYAAYALLISLLPRAASALKDAELVSLVAYLLQGKPLNEVADILGTSIPETRVKIVKSLRKLLSLGEAAGSMRRHLHRDKGLAQAP